MLFEAGRTLNENCGYLETVVVRAPDVFTLGK